MDALELPGSNDTVLNGGPILQNEYSIGITSVARSAGHTTIEFLVTKINGGTAGDGTSSVENIDTVHSLEGARGWKTSDGTLLRREVEALSGCKAKSKGESERSAS